MSERPWYPRYPQDFIMGTMGMPIDVRGAYSLLLDLMYDRGGPIPDEPRWLAGVLNVSVRKWNAIRADLIAIGKITEAGGFLSNDRMENETAKSEKISRKLAENGAKGGIKSGETRRENNKNNDLTEAKSKRIPQPQSQEKEREANASPKKGPPVPAEPDLLDLGPFRRDQPDEVQQAVDAWNALADEHGLSRCQKLTDGRRSKLRARLKDAGGIEGWKIALRKVPMIPAMLGSNDRGWKANLDFLLQESSFTKLMEGAYDGWGTTTQGGGSALMDAFDSMGGTQ